jgi:Peptidase family S41/N-terminal domain of Peptidase_S41 in eukaryotic IRBP
MSKLNIMRVPNINRFANILFALLIVTSVRGQQQITSDERNAAIQTIARHIAANYIYPEKGGQIASHIQNANFRGAFNKATTWKEFDELVTKELKSFSGDGHLYVRNDPQVVKELQNPTKANEEKGNLSMHETTPSMIADVKVLDDNVGYLKISKIDIRKDNLKDIDDAMTKVRDTRSLIIDLRDNGGGGSEVGAVLESYFLPSNMPTLQFTSRDGNVTTDSTVAWLNEKRYEKPVYILINRNTASAAEAFAFVLQQNKRAKIVGERSAGAAYMNSWYPVNDENYVSVSTAAPSVPGKNISWELAGVQPDIKVKKGDALETAVRAAKE